jgi:hypothetical protein
VGLNWQSQVADSIRRGPGRDVAVLLKIYAHCIDGQADAANKRITDALGAQDALIDSEPGDKGDDEIEQASRNARSEEQSRADGRRNRSHRPRPWVFPPRPWTKPDAHGRIADGGGAGRRLERRMCWSVAWTSDRSDGL